MHLIHQRKLGGIEYWDNIVTRNELLALFRKLKQKCPGDRKSECYVYFNKKTNSILYMNYYYKNGEKYLNRLDIESSDYITQLMSGVFKR